MSAEVQELKSLVKRLQTASTPEDTVTALKQLKTSVKATESLLRETKAGLAVGKLRTHASKDVSDLAKEIVKKWKTEVDAAKGSGGGGKTSPKTPTSPITPLGPNSLRTAKGDGVKLESTGDKTRDTCMELIYDALASDSAAPIKQVTDRATRIEGTVFAEFKTSTGGYRGKMRSLYLNLKEKSNPGLRASVVSGDLKVERFCTMTTQEMASEERKSADRAIEEKNMFLSLGAGEAAAETTAFQCGRCKQWKTRYRQAQTRSADEPMTTFVTCVNCGHRWKFS